MRLDESHQLTSERDMSLEIEIETFSGGEPFTFMYDTFVLAGADDNYRILLSFFSTSSDRLKDDPYKMVYGSAFTTWDRDNDQSGHENCAITEQRGGWWYRSCPMQNLNGNYEENVRYPTGTGIYMQYIDTQSTTPNRAIKSTEMRIRSHNQWILHMHKLDMKWTMMTTMILLINELIFFLVQ